MLKYMDEAKQTLEREIDKIAKTGDISVNTLEKLHKLTDTYKNLCKIAMLSEEECESSYEGGSSYRRGRGRNARRDSMGRYSREGGYSEEGYSEESSRRGGSSSYEGGSSYERGGRGGQGGGRGGRGGSYSYEGGYSRDGAKDYMIDKIEEMLEEVESPKERKALMECMQALERA